MVTEPTLFSQPLIRDEDYATEISGGVWTTHPPAQRHSPTSIAAAESIKPDRATLRERVFRCIMACGPITDEGIQAALAMSGNTERPRRRELQELGRIVPTGTKPCASGRQAVAWVVAR